MAAIARLGSSCLTIVPRRAFTTGTALRGGHPAGKPNDTVPFLYNQSKNLNKTRFTLGYIVFCLTGLMVPALSARDYHLRMAKGLE